MRPGETSPQKKKAVRAFTRNYRDKTDWPVLRKPTILVCDAAAELFACKLPDRNWRICGRSRRLENTLSSSAAQPFRFDMCCATPEPAKSEHAAGNTAKIDAIAGKASAKQ